MKTQLISCAVLLVAVAAFAQEKPKTSPQDATPQTSEKAAPNAQPAPPQNPASTRPLPQAKTQEEYKAFQDAMAIVQKGDPAPAEAAADDFSAKFKGGEIGTILYQRVLQLYQSANNAEKAIEVGNKIIALYPKDPIANVMVASLISERVSESDLDKNERLDQAEKNAKRALETVDTDFLVNPGTPQQVIDSSKNMIRSMAYTALANCESAKLNYNGAEQYFVKAASYPDAPLDAVSMLRWALVLDKERKYSEALVITNKAFDASPAGSQIQQMAKSERERLVMLTGKSPTPAAATPAPQTQKQST